MSSYQMKKSLRRTLGAPKSYAQIDEEAEHIDNQDRKDRDPRDIVKESIFQHKNWSVKEKIRLMVFFAYYLALPDWNSERRSIHLYKHLSNFMKKTRTPQQCKNIHSLLKRKFIRLEEVIEAMRIELQGEENYQRSLSKYEREIDAYELENKLKDERFDQQKYESLKSRKVTEKDERKQSASGDVFLKQDIRQYRAQKDVGQYNGNLNFTQFIKREEAPGSVFQTERDKLIKQSNFYFKEWLKYTLIYKHRQSVLKSQ